MPVQLRYPWDAVAIVCSCIFGILIAVGVVFRLKLSLHCRRFLGKRNKSHAFLPKSLQRAIAELEGVTDNRGHVSEQRNCEDSVCPICLSSLYSGPVGLAEGETDLESAVSRTLTAYTTTTNSTTTVEIKKKKEELALQPIDDEVLKLKRCQHMFHARCLATWFLRRRYDCPVCRTRYYQEVEPEPSYRNTHETSVVVPVLPFW